MLKKYTFWFKTAIVLQFATGVFHTISFLHNAEPQNNSEKTLFDLMTNYKFDFGFGFHHTMEDFMNAFSILFSVLLFFSAFINNYLLKNKLGNNILKGVISFNLFFYTIAFIAIAFLTFLPPIICTALIVISFLVSYLTILKEETKK